MNIINKINRCLFDSDYRFIVLAEHGFCRGMSDVEYIRHMYKAKFGYYPNLNYPKKYSEKIQWLKLHDRQPKYMVMVDKLEVKNYVANIIGDDYIVPTLGVGNHFDDLDFDSFPDRFVIKTTHDSGGVVICKDKDSFDYKKARKQIEKSLRRSFYEIYREWPYKGVSPRVICEEYLEDKKTKELRDYKFFCFDGKVKALFVASDRQNDSEETKFDFYDKDYNHLPFVNGHPNAKTPPEEPTQFRKMIEISEQLSKGIPHVRVDLYEANGKIYFGELTLYHWSGFMPFSPSIWDDRFGSWLSIPIEKSLPAKIYEDTGDRNG